MRCDRSCAEGSVHRQMRFRRRHDDRRAECSCRWTPTSRRMAWSGGRRWAFQAHEACFAEGCTLGQMQETSDA